MLISVSVLAWFWRIFFLPITSHFSAFLHVWQSDWMSHIWNFTSTAKILTVLQNTKFVGYFYISINILELVWDVVIWRQFDHVLVLLLRFVRRDRSSVSYSISHYQGKSLLSTLSHQFWGFPSLVWAGYCYLQGISLVLSQFLCSNYCTFMSWSTRCWILEGDSLQISAAVLACVLPCTLAALESLDSIPSPQPRFSTRLYLSPVCIIVCSFRIGKHLHYLMCIVFIYFVQLFGCFGWDDRSGSCSVCLGRKQIEA